MVDSCYCVLVFGVDDLIKILREPKNAIIKQYQTMLKMDGVSLEFDYKAIDAIARRLINKNRCKRFKGTIGKHYLM